MNSLNILIIEDNYEKVRVIGDVIKGNDICNLEYCNNTREALTKLRDKQYNIVIVDMVLPKCIGDHPETGAGIELIERLYSDIRLRSPNEIIAVTSHKDAFSQNKERLVELGVPFVLADDSFEIIKKTLLNKVSYCTNRNTAPVQDGPRAITQQLVAPEKVTIKWLYQHVGLNIWITGISVVIASFLFGIQSSKLTLVKQMFSLENKAVKQLTNQPAKEFIASNKIMSPSDKKDKSALRVKFTDGYAYVSLSYSTIIAPNDAPKIVAAYGTREKAEDFLSSSIISEVHSQMEKLSITEARASRETIEDSIIEATLERQSKTFVNIPSFEIMAIE